VFVLSPSRRTYHAEERRLQPAEKREPCRSVGNLSELEITQLVKQATDERDALAEATPFPCAWGAPCGKTLGLKGLVAHLRDSHGLPGKVRVCCEWNDCTDEIDSSSVKKHLLSSAHLAMPVHCPTCRHSFARPDALKRHLSPRP
jgi:hypothetical protein